MGGFGQTEKDKRAPDFGQQPWPSSPGLAAAHFAVCNFFLLRDLFFRSTCGETSFALTCKKGEREGGRC